MALYQLEVDEYNQTLGTRVHWTYPTTFDTYLNAATVKLYLQRSAAKSNWPHQPYFLAIDTPAISDAAPVESGWETIKSWSFTGTPTVTEWYDPTQPNPTFNYRLILYGTPAAPADVRGAIEWAPAAVSIYAPGTPIWAKSFGGPFADSASAVAIDSTGNSYVVGYFKNVVNLGSAGTFTSAGGADMLLLKYDPTGTLLWAKQYGGTGDETPYAIALDASNNIYVCGYYSGIGNLGGSNHTTSGQINAFLAKYDSSGVFVWDKVFGTSDMFGGITSAIDTFYGLAIDSGGNVVVAGTFQGTVNYGGDTFISLYNYTIAIVLAKYSSSGTHIWSETFQALATCSAQGIAIDSDDNIIMVGSFFGQVCFANDGVVTPGGITGSGHVLSTVNPTYQNIFLVKFDEDGVHLWSERHGGAQGDKAWAVAIDSNDDIIVGGMFYKSTNLGEGTVLGGALDLDSFVAKYAGADGAYVWGKVFIGNNGCWVNSVAVDHLNNVFVAGYFYGQFNFNGKTLTSVLISYDGYIVKCSSGGVLVYAFNYGSGSSDGIQCIRIDGQNKPIIAGVFANTVNMGGTSLVSNGAGDAMIAKLM